VATCRLHAVHVAAYLHAAKAPGETCLKHVSNGRCSNGP
jgi:hypothetical protein